MGSPNFPRLRTTDAQQSRVQDNVSGQLQPLASRLAATPIMGAPPPHWISPSLTALFANVGTAAGINNALAGYHKNALGYVYMKGHLVSAAGAAAGTVILTLDGGYRPLEYIGFPVRGFAGATNVLVVAPDGRVWPEVLLAAGDTIDLGITFLAEQ